MRRIACAAVAALLIASVAGPVSAAKPAPSGFLPPGQGIAGTALATANLLWSTAVPFDQSGWVQEKCGRSGLPGVWFLGGPPANPPTGSVTCTLPAGTMLVVEAVDLLASHGFGDGNSPKELRAAMDTGWPYLIDVDVTLDGQTVANPAAYTVTTLPVTLRPNSNMFGFTDPSLTMARYDQFVTRPLSRGTHTLLVHYEWAPGWFGTADRAYTIIAN